MIKCIKKNVANTLRKVTFDHQLKKKTCIAYNTYCSVEYYFRLYTTVKTSLIYNILNIR